MPRALVGPEAPPAGILRGEGPAAVRPARESHCPTAGDRSFEDALDAISRPHAREMGPIESRRTSEGPEVAPAGARPRRASERARDTHGGPTRAGDTPAPVGVATPAAQPLGEGGQRQPDEAGRPPALRDPGALAVTSPDTVAPDRHGGLDVGGTPATGGLAETGVSPGTTGRLADWPADRPGSAGGVSAVLAGTAHTPAPSGLQADSPPAPNASEAGAPSAPAPAERPTTRPAKEAPAEPAPVQTDRGPDAPAGSHADPGAGSSGPGDTAPSATSTPPPAVSGAGQEAHPHAVRVQDGPPDAPSAPSAGRAVEQAHGGPPATAAVSSAPARVAGQPTRQLASDAGGGKRPASDRGPQHADAIGASGVGASGQNIGATPRPDIDGPGRAGTRAGSIQADADRLLARAVAWVRGVAVTGAPALEARLHDPVLGHLRILVAGRAGDVVRAELVASDHGIADALAHAAAGAAVDNLLSGIELRIRAQTTGVGAGAAESGAAAPNGGSGADAGGQTWAGASHGGDAGGNGHARGPGGDVGDSPPVAHLGPLPHRSGRGGTSLDVRA